MNYILDIVTFLIVFLPVSFIFHKMLNIFHKRFPLFIGLHNAIRANGKEKMFSNIGWIATIILFYVIAGFFKFNNYQAGFICALINGFLLTMLEPQKV